MVGSASRADATEATRRVDRRCNGLATAGTVAGDEAVGGMTDGNTDRQGSDGGRDDGGASRATVVLGGGLVAVLLVAIGATGGWLLADEDEVPAGGPVASASATGPTTAPRPSTGRTTPSAPRTSALDQAHRTDRAPGHRHRLRGRPRDVA